MQWLKICEEVDQVVKEQLIIAVKENSETFMNNEVRKYLQPTDNFEECFISYITRLRQYSHTKLRSKRNLAGIFGMMMTSTNTWLLKHCDKLRIIVDQINESLIQYFSQNKERLKSQLVTPRIVPDFSTPIMSPPSQCLCIRGKSKLFTGNSPLIMCFLCHQSYHQICVKYTTTNQLYVCPICIITQIDLLRPVVETLCLVPFVSKRDKIIQLPFLLSKVLNPDQLIEVRCICLNDQRQEHSWPEMGELHLNNRRLEEFKPLAANSSLKHRKDDKYSTNQIKYSESLQQFNLTTRIPTDKQQRNSKFRKELSYLAGVFVVKCLEHTQLVQRIYQDKSKWITHNQMKDNIFLYVNQQQNSDIQVDNLAVSLTCQLEMTPIKTPARGSLCEHIQCFSLENFCSIMQSVKPKRWECPVCRKICLDLLIDGYQYTIIQMLQQQNKQASNIQFDSNGELIDLQVPANNTQSLQRNLFQEILFYKKQHTANNIVIP